MKMFRCFENILKHFYRYMDIEADFQLDSINYKLEQLNMNEDE